MQIQLESTELVATLHTENGAVPARLWTGHTATGIPIHAFITRIGVEEAQHLPQFERELKEPPTEVPDERIPLRLII